MRKCLSFCLFLLLSFLLVLFPNLPTCEPIFKPGEYYILYCGDSSSALEVWSQCPARDKLVLCGVTGESTVYEGRLAVELLERYRAEVLFTETACGVTSYYCYSALLPKGVWLNGKEVNFQIAESRAQTAVGTPLIFGGF